MMLTDFRDLSLPEQQAELERMIRNHHRHHAAYAARMANPSPVPAGLPSRDAAETPPNRAGAGVSIKEIA